VKDCVTYSLSPLHVFGSFEVTVSIGVTVSPGDEGPSDSNDRHEELETITVRNRTSWESLWRIVEYIPVDWPGKPGLTLQWTRAEFRFFGKIDQEISWQENVLDDN
jgi:hypothetical protein